MNMLDPLIKSLLEAPSVSPDDQGCQTMIAKTLQESGFTITHLDQGDVSNLWAEHGQQRPVLMLAGHTDVVPPGPEEQWHYSPFEPTVDQGYLYARGAADMKVALACMIRAAQQFVKDYPEHRGSLAFLITSSEEQTSPYGTKGAMQTLYEDYQKTIDSCIIGEASSQSQLGDQIKVGRRGSLSGQLTIIGQQGHVAYPHLASNPIHNVAPFIQALTQTQWDNGNEFFPPTSLQITNIHAGTGANNVIPEQLTFDFNLRYSTESTAQGLQQQIETLLQEYDLTYRIEWDHSGNPFLTDDQAWLAKIADAMANVTGYKPVMTTSGGTSDGRFIAPYGINTIELGFCNATIHKINECIAVEHIKPLQNLYYEIIRVLLT